MTLKRRLWSAVSFENKGFLFPGIANVVRFTPLTLLGSEQRNHDATFAFYIRRAEQIEDPDRYFSIAADELALLNPNTRTCPIFRSRADAEFTKKIYRNVPILIDENDGATGNPWGIRFMAMFHLSTDSDLFRTVAEFDKEAATRESANWRTSDGTI